MVELVIHIQDGSYGVILSGTPFAIQEELELIDVETDLGKLLYTVINGTAVNVAQS